MLPDSAKLLWDALQAADRLVRFVTGKSLEDYLADELLRSAVERQFEIIGEALSQLRNTDATTADLIPDLRRIVAFRNILAHGYASVNDRTVWGVIEGGLEPLSSALRVLLDET